MCIFVIGVERGRRAFTPSPSFWYFVYDFTKRFFTYFPIYLAPPFLVSLYAYIFKGTNWWKIKFLWMNIYSKEKLAAFRNSKFVIFTYKNTIVILSSFCWHPANCTRILLIAHLCYWPKKKHLWTFDGVICVDLLRSEWLSCKH